VTPFDFAEYLNLADDLATRQDEAAWRSSVSRAYYALLHVAYEALPTSIRGSISYGAIHRRTWQLYSASSMLACRRVGRIGWRLRDSRRDADYRSMIPVTQLQSQRLVTDGRRAVESIRRHGYQS
jgi:uncharacterized protein (UPF0332 family)